MSDKDTMTYIERIAVKHCAEMQKALIDLVSQIIDATEITNEYVLRLHKQHTLFTYDRYSSDEFQLALADAVKDAKTANNVASIMNTVGANIVGFHFLLFNTHMRSRMAINLLEEERDNPFTCSISMIFGLGDLNVEVVFPRLHEERLNSIKEKMISKGASVDIHGATNNVSKSLH